MENFDVLRESVDLSVKILVLIVGAVWSIYKVVIYRSFKNSLQLDIGATIYPLNEPESISGITWDADGCRQQVPRNDHTYVVEVALKYANKGKTRVRLYNIQVGINTMRAKGEAKLDKSDGHLKLRRLITSGNLVPEMPVCGNPIEKSSFYYIEPGVEQVITYLCLISEPRELIQVFAKFNLDQKRLFPEKEKGRKGLYPHTAAKTFPIPG